MIIYYITKWFFLTEWKKALIFFIIYYYLIKFGLNSSDTVFCHPTTPSKIASTDPNSFKQAFEHIWGEGETLEKDKRNSSNPYVLYRRDPHTAIMNLASDIAENKIPSGDSKGEVTMRNKASRMLAAYAYDAKEYSGHCFQHYEALEKKN